MLCQHFFDDREIAVGSLNPEHDLGAIPEGEKQFFFETFADIPIVQFNRFATKIERAADA